MYRSQRRDGLVDRRPPVRAVTHRPTVDMSSGSSAMISDGRRDDRRGESSHTQLLQLAQAEQGHIVLSVISNLECGNESDLILRARLGQLRQSVALHALC